MRLPRRRFLHLAAGVAALPVLFGFAEAQTYPARPVHIVVGAAAGGPLDTVARLIGQWLSERLGQQFVIENRTGAGTNLAAEAVVNAAPDGYTMLLCATTNAINATLYDKLSFNFIRDIAPVAGALRVPQVLEVNPSFPATNIAEFIAYAKAHPGKVNMGSGGIGSVAHLSGEMFKRMSGVDMVHVPYRGSVPMLTDLLGGELQGAFDPMPGSTALIEAGKLRALAVTTAARAPALPDVSTVGETLPGFEASTWMGFGVPRSTPAEIVDKLNREINAGLADAKIKARIAGLGGTELVLSPEEFETFIAAETEKWAKVVKLSGARPD